MIDAKKLITSPIKAIRQFCVECNGGSVYEVKNCTSPRCPLFAFRFGKNPYHTRTVSEETKAKAAERMKAIRKDQSEPEE